MPLVLVTTQTLFDGDAVTQLHVAPRALRSEELKDYQANKEDYLPPVPSVAHWRLPTRDIAADTPLRRGDLKEARKAEPLNERLSPNTRAVTVLITKEHSASGNIGVGDWVDLYLVTDVARTDNPARVPHTGLLVPQARVIAKRDSLFPVYGVLPQDPISYTLAVNPYRAALIEYGRTVGVLTMVPVSSVEKKRLDEVRDAEMKGAQTRTAAIPFAAPGTMEYKEENERIARHLKGELVVGTEDLMRVLDLRPIPPPPPPPEPEPGPPPPPPPVTVEVFTGVNKAGVATFPPPPQPAPPPKVKPYVPPPPARYIFQQPVGPDGKPLHTNGKK